MSKIILVLSILIFTTVCLFAGAFFYLVHNTNVDFSTLAHYKPSKPTILLDDQGQEWARFSYDKREPINYERMPKHLIQAFIAAEDWHFFDHLGISCKGIARSMLVNLMQGRIVQGASTITQQLVKLLFFDSQRTFSRKLKEQYYALLVEQQFTKEYILQTYLNHIYFGCGIYGVQAACQRFWGKSVEEITIDQAATLAAIVRSPARYCPLIKPDQAKQRCNIILGVMKKLHFISDQEYENAQQNSLVIDQMVQNSFAEHAKESIRVFLEEKLGKELVYGGGLTVQTTLNHQLQQAAQNSIKTTVGQLRTQLAKQVDGALLSIDTKSGAIKAMVGGYDFNQSKFNRALQAKRQMGSIFKPLIYAIAIEQGKSFNEIAIDEPLSIMMHHALWQPHNYNNEHEGSMTLARALVRSNNIIAIKLLSEIGYDRLIQVAQKCHINAPILQYPSLALGCIDVSLKEVAGMFNIFATGGIYYEPYLIQWIKDEYGRKIFKTTIKKEQVFDTLIVQQVSKVLEFGIKRMRKVYKKELVDSDVICKTGTTNESRTCWFAGATPDLTTISYIGCDDNQSLGVDVYPLRTAFPLWLGLHENHHPTQKHFAYDVALQEIAIDSFSGRVISADNRNAINILMPNSLA